MGDRISGAVVSLPGQCVSAARQEKVPPQGCFENRTGPLACPFSTLDVVIRDSVLDENGVLLCRKTI